VPTSPSPDPASPAEPVAARRYVTGLIQTECMRSLLRGRASSEPTRNAKGRPRNSTRHPEAVWSRASRRSAMGRSPDIEYTFRRARSSTRPPRGLLASDSTGHPCSLILELYRRRLSSRDAGSLCRAKLPSHARHSRTNPTRVARPTRARHTAVITAVSHTSRRLRVAIVDHREGSARQSVLTCDKHGRCKRTAPCLRMCQRVLERDQRVLILVIITL
jgi:hypothetical protein